MLLGGIFSRSDIGLETRIVTLKNDASVHLP